MGRPARAASVSIGLALAACGAAHPALDDRPRCDLGLAAEALDAWDLAALDRAGQLDGADIWIAGGFAPVGPSTCVERRCAAGRDCGTGELRLSFRPAEVASHGTDVTELRLIGWSGARTVCTVRCVGTADDRATFDVDEVACPFPRHARTFVRARVYATPARGYDMEVLDLCVLPARIRPDDHSVEQFVHEARHSSRELQLAHPEWRERSAEPRQQR